MSTWVCIAARNEAATIRRLVKELWALGLYCAVTDDASTDDTARGALASGASIVRHKHCMGIAQSVMDAWEYALGQGASRIIQMDAGGSHRPEDALALIDSDADVVVGSRFFGEYQGRYWRALASRGASWMCSVKTGVCITDWTSGYRAFTTEAVERLLRYDYQARRHGWQIEVLRAAIEEGMSIEERPITYKATDSSFNVSAAREAFDVWRSL